MQTLLRSHTSPRTLYYPRMPVLISMLRGVNVGPHNRVKMDALRALYQSLKLEDPRTYVQSGNVIFRTKDSRVTEKTITQLAERIQNAIAQEFGFRPAVILRTPQEFRSVIAANPFAGRKHLDPTRLLVTFLASEPATEARAQLLALKPNPEELHLIGREVYIYFPNGIGRSKLPWASMEKKLETPGTARNLNSVIKMLEIVEEVAAAD
jgi:uncharacterized protein (DUF1697 family)